MDLTSQILLYLGIYIFWIIFYSIYIGNKQSQEDFLISGRNRSWISLGMSKYSTSIWASWFITYTAYIYEFGIGVFVYVLGYFLAMLILWFYIWPKLHAISKEQQFLWIGNIIYYMTGSKWISRLADVFWSVGLFVWLLVTVIWWANLIEFFGILSYEFSLLSLLLVVLLYIMNIGYKWVVTTDILQSGLILIVLVLMWVSLFRDVDITTASQISFDTLSPGTIAWFLVFWLFSAFPFVDRYQLLFSGKDEKSIKKWFTFVIPLILVSVTLLLIIGYVVRQNTSWLDPSIVFLHAIETYIPHILLPFVMVMFFAALMSTVDSGIHGIASNTKIFWIKNSVDNIRLNSVMLAATILIVCYFFRDIIDVTVFAAALSLILSLPMIYILFGKKLIHRGKSPSRVMSSIILWFIWVIIGLFLVWIVPDLVLFPIVFGAIGLLFSNKKLDVYLSRI